MPEVSTKPYLIRAIYDWCTDAGFTPYVAVAVDESVRVPMEFVKNGEIVLNLSTLATNRLKIGNDAIEFQARFSGVPREVYVPVTRVIAVYARENGQGMAFEVPRGESAGVMPIAPAMLPPTAEGVRERGSLVPVESAAEARTEPTPEPTPPAPKAGDRPKLTRVK
jgi:stringent starvation protein B